jgi:AcrR family transcriptional regulator
VNETAGRTRRYDASRRQEQARANRARVLAEARRLFLERGYAETAMGAVAEAAGVSVQTVYKVFANKASLLKAVFDVAVSGDDEAEAMADREVIAAVRAERSPSRKIELYTRHLGEIAHRHMPVQLLARNAAVADAAAAHVWTQIRQETLTAMTHMAADLIETGRVRADLSAEDVRDILWTYHSAELYELLVADRGWSPERYGRFIGEAMIDAVLD